MSNVWLSILKRHVTTKGRNIVRRELNISSTTLSQVLNDKYPASTEHIEERVMTIYGHAGKVQCPVLGEIEPAVCLTKWKLAGQVRGAGNPATIKLYIACRKCDVRSK